MFNTDESIEMLETLLYNAIISWYDNSITEYHGLDDEDFINRVCERTGMTEADYEDLITGRREDCSWNN